MTEIDFQYGIRNLKMFYGEKYFPPQRLKIIAERLKILTGDDFYKVCEEIIASQNKAPDLKDFLEFSRDLRNLRYDEYEIEMYRELSLRPECEYCSNSGFELRQVTRSGHKYLYSWGCRDFSCLAAKLKCPPSEKRFSESYFQEFQKRVEGEHLRESSLENIHG